MEVSSLLTNGIMQGLEWFQMKDGLQAGQKPLTEDMGSDAINLSMASKFRTFFAEISEEDRADMKAFHEEMISAIQSGTFDVSEMAEKAPEQLKSWAEENGIDLETMLTSFADKAEEMEEKFSGMRYNSQGIGLVSSFQDHIMDLVRQLSAEEDSENDSSQTSIKL